MATLNIDRFKNVSLQMGGADAFVETNLTTLIYPENGEAWKIREVEMQFTPNLLKGIAADSYVAWSITRDTKVAVAQLGDADSVHFNGFEVALTTSGAPNIPLLYTWRPTADVIFVEPIMYFQLVSGGTGLTLTAKMRIHYDIVKVNEVEILRMLNNS